MQVDNVRSLHVVLGMEDEFNRKWLRWLAENNNDPALTRVVERLLDEGAEATERLRHALTTVSPDRKVPIPEPADHLEVLETAVESKRALSEFYEVAARAGLPADIATRLRELAEVERRQAAVLATFLPAGRH